MISSGIFFRILIAIIAAFPMGCKQSFTDSNSTYRNLEGFYSVESSVYSDSVIKIYENGNFDATNLPKILIDLNSDSSDLLTVSGNWSLSAREPRNLVLNFEYETKDHAHSMEIVRTADGFRLRSAIGDPDDGYVVYSRRK